MKQFWSGYNPKQNECTNCHARGEFGSHGLCFTCSQSTPTNYRADDIRHRQRRYRME